MLFAVSLTVAAAIVSAATPPQPPSSSIALPLKRLSRVNSVRTIAQKGRARLHHCNGDRPVTANKVVGSGAVTNDDSSYVAAVSIGSGTWDLVIDTGSANTWCGVRRPCEPTSTGKSTNATIRVNYGSGSMSGNEYTDKVGFGSLSVASQSIGAANATAGFDFGVDGILGFGPVGLTQRTVSNADTVPTFMNNLYRQGSIPSEVLGVYFKPEVGSGTADTNGALTLGGIDSSKFKGPLTLFPTLKTGPAARYWGISISHFSYGSTVLATSATGYVDTGTTLIYIPTAAYNKFLALTGGQTDNDAGLAAFKQMPTANFGITFGSTTYILTPAQYLVPAAQYGAFGLTTGKYYAWFNDGGNSSVSTAIGQKFLEHYYSVYDTTHSRIGFAVAA